MQLLPMKTRRELQEQPAVRAQNTKKLFEIAPRFSRVLDDVSRKDEVERLGLERQRLAGVHQGKQTFQPTESPVAEIHVYGIDLDTVNGARAPLPGDQHLATDFHSRGENARGRRENLGRDSRRDVTKSLAHYVERHRQGDRLGSVPVSKSLEVTREHALHFGLGFL